MVGIKEYLTKKKTIIRHKNILQEPTGTRQHVFKQMMIFNVQNFAFLVVFLIIAFMIIMSLIYCCTCNSIFANTRRRLIDRQITHDEAIINEERRINQAQLQSTISNNQQLRNDFRNKYELV
jgi:hypothetical protein